MLTPLLKLSLATTARGLFSVTGWPRDRVKTPVCVWCTPWLGSLLPLSKPYIRLGVEREVPPIAHNAGSHDRPSFDTDFSSSCFLQITGLVSFLPPLLHSLLPHTYLRGTPPRNSRAGGLIFFRSLSLVNDLKTRLSFNCPLFSFFPRFDPSSLVRVYSSSICSALSCC